MADVDANESIKLTKLLNKYKAELSRNSAVGGRVELEKWRAYCKDNKLTCYQCIKSNETCEYEDESSTTSRMCSACFTFGRSCNLVDEYRHWRALNELRISEETWRKLVYLDSSLCPRVQVTPQERRLQLENDTLNSDAGRIKEELAENQRKQEEAVAKQLQLQKRVDDLEQVLGKCKKDCDATCEKIKEQQRVERAQSEEQLLTGAESLRLAHEEVSSLREELCAATKLKSLRAKQIEKDSRIKKEYETKVAELETEREDLASRLEEAESALEEKSQSIETESIRHYVWITKWENRLKGALDPLDPSDVSSTRDLRNFISDFHDLGEHHRRASGFSDDMSFASLARLYLERKRDAGHTRFGEEGSRRKRQRRSEDSECDESEDY